MDCLFDLVRALAIRGCGDFSHRRRSDLFGLPLRLGISGGTKGHKEVTSFPMHMRYQIYNLDIIT